MTRINCVPPAELCRQHLVAEYRELPRVFKVAAYAISYGWSLRQALPTYRLGEGHVRFFFSRLQYLENRHRLIVQEMQSRGYETNLVEPGERWRHIPSEYWQDWEPTPEALALCRARIAERLPASLRSPAA